MRRGLGEDRLHEPTIAARPGLCLLYMSAANRGGWRARSKKPPAAIPTSASSGPRDTRVNRDIRRWIYVGLDLAFATLYVIAIWKVIPNRLASAQVHLWSFPVATVAMAVGTSLDNPRGWWIAVVAGSAALLSTILLIVRILISAAFLAGVYGAFGKAAATFALVVVALAVELVALLPIVQVKYLITRAGRRAYGMQSS